MSGLPGYDSWLEAPLVDQARAELAYERADETAAEWNRAGRCRSCGEEGKRALCVDVEHCHDDGEDHEICRACRSEWEGWTPEAVLADEEEES